jgi:hypothetical protein
MDEFLAKQILNIVGNYSERSLAEQLNNKRTELILRNDYPEDAQTDGQRLDEAYVFLLDIIKRQSNNQELQESEKSLNHGMVLYKDLILNQNTQGEPLLSPCPYCGKLKPFEALICDQCSKQVSRSCPSCGHIVSLNTRVCERCKTIISEFDKNRYITALAAEQRTNLERDEIQRNKKIAKTANQKFILRGLVLWAVIILLIVLFLVTAYIIFNKLTQ